MTCWSRRLTGGLNFDSGLMFTARRHGNLASATPSTTSRIPSAGRTGSTPSSLVPISVFRGLRGTLCSPSPWRHSATSAETIRRVLSLMWPTRRPWDLPELQAPAIRPGTQTSFLKRQETQARDLAYIADQLSRQRQHAVLGGELCIRSPPAPPGGRT